MMLGGGQKFAAMQG